MSELFVWQFISDHLGRGENVMLMCVVESNGSSPGRQGFKMAIANDGMTGSIGGGVMEHKFVELAKEKLKSGKSEPDIRKQIHSKNAVKDQSGMICSGEQTILIFQLTQSHSNTVDQIIRCREEYKSGSLVITTKDFLFNTGSSGINYFENKNDNEWTYSETLGYKNHLYIIGGGHCSNAFAKLMSAMDFYIHVYESRNNLNTFISNEFAHEKILVENYSTLNKIIPSGENHYVVIMTFGYRTDDIALRSLISNDYKYLGVLGSKAKIEKMFVEWRATHLPEEKLKTIHAPIGISINSQTPVEIAISIAAEIIAVKNGTTQT